MKIQVKPLATLFLLLFGHSIFAQVSNAFPPWDYRSGNWLFGRVGVGYQFSNQNRNLYFFTETDLCFSCAITHYVRPPENLHQQLRRNRFRGSMHLRLQTSKDFSLYGTTFSRNNPDIEFKNLSWTYLTNVGVSAEMGLYSPGKIADLSTGELNDRFRKRERIRLRYDILSRYHSYYYRRLSNTVGYVGLHVLSLDGRWGTGLTWGNDFFISQRLRKFIVNHDHGETNAVFLTAFWRPNEHQNGDPNGLMPYPVEKLQKLELTLSSRMITDRNVSKSTLNNQMRAGMYNVIGLKNAFHGYFGAKIGAEGGFWAFSTLLGKDDLLWGRDMQRFAHQGYAHLPGKFARKLLLKSLRGTSSPLFPWESQPLYYKKPKFYYEVTPELLAPYRRSFN